jgi:MYXO-CTERM domain-containing protein
MRRALSLFAAAIVMLVSAKASASFHLIKVVEVFVGSSTAPDAHYVQLQMYAAGQNFVGGHVLRVYDASGVEISGSSFTFPAMVANGSDQANILIGTAAVTAAFGVAPDFTLPAKLSTTGGAVCFDATSLGLIDCFSWGTFMGGAADTSVAPFQFVANKAARRIITGGASMTKLEAADDGNNNSTDFASVDPAPKNNNNGTTATDGGTSGGVDASVPDGSTPGKDSGIGTTPSPGNPTVQPDSGASSSGGAPSSDSGGCSVVSSSSESSAGWSTALGLVTAASILMMSRRRRRGGR